jgi:hypothetical protein
MWSAGGPCSAMMVMWRATVISGRSGEEAAGSGMEAAAA